MAVANIGTGIGLGITGVMADNLGFRWSFVVVALLNILALPLMGIIFTIKAKPAVELSNIQ
jgi:PAT family beta-lactamase induction signal transducer AmpG